MTAVVLAAAIAFRPGLAATQETIPDTAGLVDPSQGQWHLRNSDGEVTTFFYGNPGDFPITGDWNCDGIDTPGMYRQSDGFVYLRNSNTQGVADVRFFFGDPGDIPLAGDFNGNGCDTVSIYRPLEGRVFIINQLGENEGGLGAAEFDYFFGNPGDKPFVGDFNGDGVDTIGLHRESTGFVYFRQTHTQGVADSEFFFGDPGDRLVAGDWGIVDNVDTPAIFRPSDRTFYFRHTNTQGVADSQFAFGQGTWLPVAGSFGDAAGTRTDPIPLGTTRRIANWDITVLSVTPDATDLVLAENIFNDPPAPGNQFFIAEIAATYRGPSSSRLFFDTSFSSVGQSNVTYSVVDSCGVIPDDLDDFREVFTGGTIFGNVCWEIGSQDTQSMLLIVDDDDFFSDQRLFFDLPTSGQTASVSPGTPPLPDPNGPVGSRGNPISMGTTARIANWDIAVVSVIPDATDLVLAENIFNDPPAPGNQFFIAEISATYRGPGSSKLFLDVTFSTVGFNAVAYDIGHGCGVIPDPLDDFREVFTGGAVQGNECWEIGTGDATSLVLIVDDDALFSDDRLFFGLG